MIWLYILLIVLSAFPLVLTIYRMRRAADIKKNGVHVNAVVRDIKTMRTGKTTMDLLILEYTDRATGRTYPAKATVTYGRNKIGDTISVAYLPNQPGKHAIDNKGAYWVILVFCIILFLFIIFVIYKLNGMTGINV